MAAQKVGRKNFLEHSVNQKVNGVTNLEIQTLSPQIDPGSGFYELGFNKLYLHDGCQSPAGGSQRAC